MSPAPSMPPVSTGAKVIVLAEEIAQLEQRYEYLIDRNAVLMGKVMLMRSSMAGKSMMGNDKVRMRRSFEGWRSFVQDHRLENHLEKQTHTLDEFQQVVKELGQALAEEQEQRRTMDEVAFNTREEIRRVLANSEALQQGMDDQKRKMAMAKMNLQEAESLIRQSRGDGYTIMQHADNYERASKQLDKHAKEGKPVPAPRGHHTADAQHPDHNGLRPPFAFSKAPDLEDTGMKLERGTKVREEAAGAIQQARGMLPAAPRLASPERELPGAGAPQGRSASAAAWQAWQQQQRPSPQPPTPPPQPPTPQPQRQPPTPQPAPARQQPMVRPPAPASPVAAAAPIVPPGGSSPARERPKAAPTSPQNQARVVLPVQARTALRPAPAPMAPSSPVYAATMPPSIGGPGCASPVGSPVQRLAAPFGAPAAGAAASTLPAGQQQVLEPWWCVRRVGTDGRPMITPQTPQG